MFSLVESLGGGPKFDDISGSGEPMVKIIKKSREMQPAKYKNFDVPPEIPDSLESEIEINR